MYNDKSPEGVSRFENIQELLNGIKDFCENTEKNSLTEYMTDVALLTNQDNEKEEDLNKVTLMTVHAAKGLEFPYVFIVGLEQNLFPSMMSGDSQENLEEERRLFYVAITRAEKRLFLSFATNRFKWGQFIDCEPSRFLSELDSKYLEKTEIHAKKKEKFFKQKKQGIKNRFEKKNLKPNIPSNLKKVNTSLTGVNSSDINKIQNGMNVLHSKFGNGKIIEISGEDANKKATIFFEKFGQKQLLLKFAKLEII